MLTWILFAGVFARKNRANLGSSWMTLLFVETVSGGIIVGLNSRDSEISSPLNLPKFQTFQERSGTSRDMQNSIFLT